MRILDSLLKYVLDREFLGCVRYKGSALPLNTVNMYAHYSTTLKSESIY